MTYNAKVELARKAVERGSCGLYFIDEILRHKNGGTDMVFSRSWYILLSFNFELILKAILIIESKETTKQKILDSIKNHDLQKLSKIVDKISLNKYGIDSIKKEVNNSFISYIVKISNDRGSITIQDLIDVRYDFQKEELRIPDPKEISRIKNEVELLLSVVNEIKKVVYLTSSAQRVSKS